MYIYTTTKKQAKDVDAKAAKRAKEKAAVAASGGVGLIQSFFFNKKVTPPAPAPTPAPVSAPAPATSRAPGGPGPETAGAANGNGNKGRSSPPPGRSRFSNGGVAAAVGGVGGDGDEASEELNRLIEGAVPVEFAGRSWEGYLHHVDFIVALMHVGTSLIPKNLIKVCGACGGMGAIAIERVWFYFC